MRAAGDPDIYPNLGKFKISYALYPHSGDWRNGVWMEGDDFNVPIHAAEPPSRALVSEHATRPEEDSFISIDASGVFLTGIKKAEDSRELVVRLVEVEGSEKALTLSMPKTIEAVRRLNLIELPLDNASKVTVSGHSLSLLIKPHEIVTLGIELE